ncbi:MAG: hypothetical protein RR853_02125 [Aurantimicrobium sp.]|uniref:hypothetical protein n=1 Tax=Aurantimicrobium sp. TaxID=1930784 RepID=UPI002FC91686
MSIEASHADSKSIRLDTVFLTGIFVYFIFTVADGIRIFQQFSWLQVTSVGAIFLLLSTALMGVFNLKKLSLLSFRFSASALLVGFLLAVVLFVIGLSALNNWIDYFPSSPLAELNEGRGLHPDTVFHVSLIQSILNVGYPSTGQHGLPFLPYHVLSHYVDAGILAITGLEPLDAYGLLYHFKIFAFLTAGVVFLWTILRTKNSIWVTVAVLLFIPALAGNWLVIGSEGLWFTSLIVLYSAPLVYRILIGSTFSTVHLLILSSLGIVIGVGKVSSGLAFALLVGFYLLFKHFKNPRIYLLGTIWVVFFAIFSVAQDSGSSGGIKLPHLSGITGFLNPWTTYPGGPVEWNLVGIYAVVAVLLLVWFLAKYKQALLLAVSTGISLLLLSLLMMLPAPAGLTQPDIAYFVLGLYFLLLLLGLICSIDAVSELSNQGQSTSASWRSQLIVTAMLLFSLVLPKPDLSHVSFQPVADKQQGSVEIFRAELASYMRAHGLSKHNSNLIIPREEFETSIAAWGSPYWSEGMNVYALTGVPLRFGVTDASVQNFGQNGYKDSLAKTRQELAGLESKHEFSSSYVVLEQSQPLGFRIVRYQKEMH